MLLSLAYIDGRILIPLTPNDSRADGIVIEFLLVGLFMVFMMERSGSRLLHSGAEGETQERATQTYEDLETQGLDDQWPEPDSCKLCRGNGFADVGCRECGLPAQGMLTRVSVAILTGGLALVAALLFGAPEDIMLGAGTGRLWIAIAWALRSWDPRHASSCH